jgi:hypothetical protein
VLTLPGKGATVSGMSARRLLSRGIADGDEPQRVAGVAGSTVRSHVPLVLGAELLTGAAVTSTLGLGTRDLAVVREVGR